MLTTGGLIGNKASSNTGEKWGLIDKTGKEIFFYLGKSVFVS